MGREIKRVPLDFDWPLNTIWPGYMGGICTEDVGYAIGVPKGEHTSEQHDQICEACRHAARLAGLPTQSHGCPNWRITPLAGNGYQLWETVTEGSPISPVFATPEELADWLVVPGNDTSITEGTSREQWLRLIRGSGWAWSMVYTPETGLVPGTQMEPEA